MIDSDVQDAVTEMLEEIYQIFQMDFRDDLELILSLSTHLVPLIIRIKYGMRLKNPLLKEIRQRYSLAYTIALCRQAPCWSGGTAAFWIPTRSPILR